MEQNEHIDAEQVLYKARGTLNRPRMEPEEADFIITDTNLVIETEQPIAIPLHRINNTQIDNTVSASPSPGVRMESSMTISYSDDLEKKQHLTMKADAPTIGSFSNELSSAREKAKKQWEESLPVEQRYVGFGRRLAAWLLDAVILAIVSVVIGLILRVAGVYAGSIAIDIVQFLISVVYFVGFWTWQSATLGKMMMGLKIIKTNGQPVDIGTAIVRYIGYIISAVILFIGYLMIAWDGKKQGLHDKIAGTLVIRVS